MLGLAANYLGLVLRPPTQLIEQAVEGRETKADVSEAGHNTPYVLTTGRVRKDQLLFRLLCLWLWCFL